MKKLILSLIIMTPIFAYSIESFTGYDTNQNICQMTIESGEQNKFQLSSSLIDHAKVTKTEDDARLFMEYYFNRQNTDLLGFTALTLGEDNRPDMLVVGKNGHIFTCFFRL